MATPANSAWSTSIAFNPSINSDLEQGLGSNAWNWDGRAMMFFRVAPQWTWVVGAGFWDRVNDRVIPYAGAIWVPDDRWEWRMVLPEPRVSYYIGRPCNLPTWFYARAEYHVEAYEIQLETTGAREKVELEDWRILLGLRFDNGFYSSFVEAGWIFGRIGCALARVSGPHTRRASSAEVVRRVASGARAFSFTPSGGALRCRVGRARRASPQAPA